MKLYRNWIINEVARAGEHTNEPTYVRTYSHTYVRDRPYIPSTTLLCEGIIKTFVVSVIETDLLRHIGRLRKSGGQKNDLISLLLNRFS